MIKCIQPRDWFCSDRPERGVLSCFDPSATRPFLRFASEVGPWQYRSSPSGSPCPPVSSRRSQRAPLPRYGSGHQDPHCLEHGPCARTVVRSQGPGASAPQPVGASGQLGKEQPLPCAENLFSWLWEVRLCEYDGAPHGRARPISAELPEFLQRQDCGSAETVSEAPGTYGIRSCSHTARIASYETTSALVALPSPENRIRNNELDGTDWTLCWFHTDYFITECLFSIRYTSSFYRYNSHVRVLSFSLSYSSFSDVFRRAARGDGEDKEHILFVSFFFQNHKFCCIRECTQKK